MRIKSISINKKCRWVFVFTITTITPTNRWWWCRGEVARALRCVKKFHYHPQSISKTSPLRLSLSAAPPDEPRYRIEMKGTLARWPKWRFYLGPHCEYDFSCDIWSGPKSASFFCAPHESRQNVRRLINESSCLPFAVSRAHKMGDTW